MSDAKQGEVHAALAFMKSCILSGEPWTPESEQIFKAAMDDLARVKRMEEALRELLADPHGCRFCDSGTLRNPLKGHEEGCGFAMARAALADSPGKGDGK